MVASEQGGAVRIFAVVYMSEGKQHGQDWILFADARAEDAYLRLASRKEHNELYVHERVAVLLG